MDFYTKEMFEKELSKNKNRILIRNGEFVGLYRYDKKLSELILTKSIVNEPYGSRRTFEVESIGSYWGSGGSNGISAIINANEAHLIPNGYTLSLKSHLRILDDCLGGSYVEVSRKIKQREPYKKPKPFWLCF